MPTWLLRVLHFVGLTNLSDEEVNRYAALRAFDAAQRAAAKAGRPIVGIAYERDVQKEQSVMPKSYEGGLYTSVPCIISGVMAYGVQQVITGYMESPRSPAEAERRAANATHG